MRNIIPHEYFGQFSKSPIVCEHPDTHCSVEGYEKQPNRNCNICDE